MQKIAEIENEVQCPCCLHRPSQAVKMYVQPPDIHLSKTICVLESAHAREAPIANTKSRIKAFQMVSQKACECADGQDTEEQGHLRPFGHAEGAHMSPQKCPHPPCCLTLAIRLYCPYSPVSSSPDVPPKVELNLLRSLSQAKLAKLRRELLEPSTGGGGGGKGEGAAPRLFAQSRLVVSGNMHCSELCCCPDTLNDDGGLAIAADA